LGSDRLRDNGVASFNLVRYLHHDESIFLYAFDLIEFNGDDLRRDPLAGPETPPRYAALPLHAVTNFRP
jgi:hypothetical protein